MLRPSAGLWDTAGDAVNLSPNLLKAFLARLVVLSQMASIQKPCHRRPPP